MNLASPFVPQSSSLFSWDEDVIDATRGQYEGYNYFGLGLLLASLLVMPAQVRWLRRNLKRHAALFFALVTLTLFAVSHRVYAGHWLLVEFPLPYYVVRILGIFRSSGRFFWLIYYAQMAVAMVLAFRGARPLFVVCLMGLMILQVVEVQRLRQQLIDSIAEAPAARCSTTTKWRV